MKKIIGGIFRGRAGDVSLRIAGLIVLAALVAGSCTGRGCSGCSGCQTCGGPSPTAGGSAGGCAGPQTGGTVKPGPGVGPGAVQPGTPSVPSTGGAGPYHPASILSSNTAEYKPTAEQASAAEDRLKKIIASGEGVNPPAAPTGLTATADASGVRVNLQWQAPEKNAIAYQVDRADQKGFFALVLLAAAGTNSVSDGPLAAGTYSYRVRAIGATGVSAYAGPVSVELKPAATAPAAPASLTAVAGPGLRVVLQWSDNSDNESYFRLERADGGGNFYSLGQVGPDAHAYEDTRVETGLRYVYRVIAGNAAGESAPSNTAEALLKKETKAPAAPVNLQAAVIGPGAVSLAWEDRSDNEDRFFIEQKIADRDQYYRIQELAPNSVKALLSGLASEIPITVRVRAENTVGQSEPSNAVTVTPQSTALAMFMMRVDSSGQVAIDQPSDAASPRLVVKSAAVEGGVIVAAIAVRNPDPAKRLLNVYATVEYADKFGVQLLDCDRGPISCVVDDGVGANPVGYQYVEDGYLGTAPHGGALETYKTRDRKFAVRDIWPACGSVTKTWTIGGISGPTLLAVTLYGDRLPADFRQDPRFNPDQSLWLVEPYSIGVGDGLNEPGSRNNPSARPVNHLKPGDVFAVNISVEAADWLEKQAEIGRLQDDPKADYDYWRALAFALTYDPAVIQPISKAVVMPWGDVLRPGIRDPLMRPHVGENGWSADLASVFPFPTEGWMQALFEYPTPFTTDQDESGKNICAHCGQEGFVGPTGVLQGPDPQPEVTLGLIYFQVTGDPGTGAALRLAPKPETYIQLYNTSGTLNNFRDDAPLDDWREINSLLPPTFQLPGDYQVQESYLCVE